MTPFAMPKIVSIQVGRAQRHEYEAASDGKPRTWTSAFFKSAVAGPVFAQSLGLAGDEQADRQNHGGLDKAVLAYSAEHYADWDAILGRSVATGNRLASGFAWSRTAFGAFGENLTIAGLDESTVCVGDRWQAGAVVFEVSQPRQPCWKLGRRWQLPDLPKQVIQNGKSGWYLRVVVEGELAAGAAFELVDRPNATWTIARMNRLFFHDRKNTADLATLANLPALSAAWREGILERLSS